MNYWLLSKEDVRVETFVNVYTFITCNYLYIASERKKFTPEI